MSTETKAAWKEEWEYRYSERVGLLTNGGEASEEIKTAARVEADDGIKKLKYVAAKRRLTDAWCEAYAKAHGFRYMFQGAKDGTAADRLLKLGLTVTEIMTVAQEAWKHPDWFNCKQAASLAGFVCRFNEIRMELAKPPGKKFFEPKSHQELRSKEIRGMVDSTVKELKNYEVP